MPNTLLLFPPGFSDLPTVLQSTLQAKKGICLNLVPTDNLLTGSNYQFTWMAEPGEGQIMLTTLLLVPLPSPPDFQTFHHLLFQNYDSGLILNC